MLLDVGCCCEPISTTSVLVTGPTVTVGADTRKASLDGWLVKQIVATDIVSGFWDLGHKLFRSSAASFPAVFQADLLNLVHVTPGPPAENIPDLASLSLLNRLRGQVMAIHAAAVFHLFFEEQQLVLAVTLRSLLANVSGASIFGWSTGLAEVGFLEIEGNVSHPRQFCHSPSWVALWDGVVFPKGFVKVEARLVEFDYDVGVRVRDGLALKRLE